MSDHLEGFLPDNHAFLSYFPDAPGTGPTVGVKGIIDVEGKVTTLGSAYIAEVGLPAERDAACLEGLRAADARVVGITACNECAFGSTGITEGFDTPVNPYDSERVPGGSSSGSAVAVGAGQVEISLGTDTGGSIRTPAACCAVTGLKTTHGRIATEGVWPLAPSLDTVGPLARDVAGVAKGMALLEPGFAVRAGSPGDIGRVYLPGVDRSVELTIDAVLHDVAGRFVNVPAVADSWDKAFAHGSDILWGEASQSNLPLKPHWNQLESGERLYKGEAIWDDADRMNAAYAGQKVWRQLLQGVLGDVEFLILPTLEMAAPPTLEQMRKSPVKLTRPTSPVNLAGLPAVSIPLLSKEGGYPISMQLIGSAGGEERLLGAAHVIESVARERVA